MLEAEDQVGGLAKTVVRDGYRFDLGGHRFFTKAKEVERLWHEVMGDEFLLRPRMSRIYWNGKFLDYPLRGTDVIRKLGPVELARVSASYVAAAVRPKGHEETFEEWVSNRFGRRLFELFFRDYTEKVWGVPTSELRAEWAAQRIKGLSFVSAAKAAFFGNKGNKVKSLIQQFHYPRYGPGQMWETMTDEIRALGGEVRTSTPVERLDRRGRHASARSSPAASASSRGTSSPRSRCGRRSRSAEPARARRRARGGAPGLRYRDFLTVALVLDGEDLFPDNWIYIHEPGVRVGRIQNYRSWSPWMVPDPTKACVGLEYFCFAGRRALDDERRGARRARRRPSSSGSACADASKVERGYVVRVPKAYPMYDADYAERVATIRGWLDGIENLQQVGRNGLHRYNNSDHSMLTAIRAVENAVLGSRPRHLGRQRRVASTTRKTSADEHPYRDAPETPSLKAPVAS